MEKEISRTGIVKTEVSRLLKECNLWEKMGLQ